MESFQHRAAKELLAKWLTKPPPGWPWFGDGRVFVEYPILFEDKPLHCSGIGRYSRQPWQARHTGLDMLWDEVDWESGVYPQGHSRRESELVDRPNAIPTYDELASVKAHPAIIADIVVSHKGAVKTLIEIEHKNKLSETKLEKLRRLQLQETYYGNFSVYTVPAVWIMHQVEVPKTFAGALALEDPEG